MPEQNRIAPTNVADFPVSMLGAKRELKRQKAGIARSRQMARNAGIMESSEADFRVWRAFFREARRLAAIARARQKATALSSSPE